MRGFSIIGFGFLVQQVFTEVCTWYWLKGWRDTKFGKGMIHILEGHMARLAEWEEHFKIKYQNKAVNVEWLAIKCWYRSEDRQRDYPELEVKEGLELPWKVAKERESQRGAVGLHGVSIGTAWGKDNFCRGQLVNGSGGSLGPGPGMVQDEVHVSFLSIYQMLTLWQALYSDLD